MFVSHRSIFNNTGEESDPGLYICVHGRDGDGEIHT